MKSISRSLTIFIYLLILTGCGAKAPLYFSSTEKSTKSIIKHF